MTPTKSTPNTENKRDAMEIVRLVMAIDGKELTARRINRVFKKILVLTRAIWQREDQEKGGSASSDKSVALKAARTRRRNTRERAKKVSG